MALSLLPGVTVINDISRPGSFLQMLLTHGVGSRLMKWTLRFTAYLVLSLTSSVGLGG